MLYKLFCSEKQINARDLIPNRTSLLLRSLWFTGNQAGKSLTCTWPCPLFTTVHPAFKPTHLIDAIKSEIHETHTSSVKTWTANVSNPWRWEERTALVRNELPLNRITETIDFIDVLRHGKVVFFCHLPVDTKGLKLVRATEDNNVYCQRWWDYGLSVFGGKTSFPSCIRDFFPFNSCARFIVHLFNLFGTTWPLLTNSIWWNGDIALIHPLWQYKLI